MRARNLKPSLFTNELLAVANPLHTLIFEGLWCLADREGRLEDRPARIHMAINPGRGFDSTAESLGWLVEHGFILRYAIGEASIIQVVNFAKHQNPHHREPPSTLPAIGDTEASGSKAIHKRKASGQDPVKQHGISQEPGESPGPSPTKSPVQGPSAVLIPDSGFRIPDSPHYVREASPPPRSNGAKNGSRRTCPESFEPDVAFALEMLPDLDVPAEVAKFRDWEFKQPHSDWNRTWRRWVRKAKEDGRYSKRGLGGIRWE